MKEEIAFRLTRLGGQLLLSGDEGANMLLERTLTPRADPPQSPLWRRLHHDDARLGPRDHQVEVLLSLAHEGLMMNWPSTRPTRTAAIRLGKGISLTARAAEAPVMRGYIGRVILIHGEWSRHDSLPRRPVGKRGRSGGRSGGREDGKPLGRPSRLMRLPIRP